MKAATAYRINEKELLDAMAVAIASLSNGFADMSREGLNFVARNNFVLSLSSTLPLSNPENRAMWRKDIRMAVYHNTSTTTLSSTASNDTLKAFLTLASNDSALLRTPSAHSLLALEIGGKLFSFLLKPEEDLETSCSLAGLGMDSLVAIEMRSWWKQVFGFDITILQMLAMPTLDALGQHAAVGLLKVLHEEEEVKGE